MNWGKTLAGILTAIICVVTIGAVLWLVFQGNLHQVVPDGTLVRQWHEEVTA